MKPFRSPFNCKAICTAGYPKYPSGNPHSGEDWVPENRNIESNWNLYSPCNGKVYVSKKQTGRFPGGFGAYGNYLVIQSNEGQWILMAHMKNVPIVKAGQTVTKGQQVGVAGETGNVTGRHLHIEVSNMNGVKYNSATWYAEFERHLLKPSDYIDFENFDIDEGGFDVKEWHNGSTTEPVYQTTTDCKAGRNRIGSLAPYESCECYGIIDGVYLVAYRVNGTTATKCGFVKYRGGMR